MLTVLFLTFLSIAFRCESIELQNGVTDVKSLKGAIEILPQGFCKDDLQSFLDGLQSNERWAMLMFDASVKFPFGLLYGNAYQLGNFDECINIYNETKEIRGQYCLIEVNMKNKTQAVQDLKLKEQRRKNISNGTIHWALCLPNSCSSEEITTLVGSFFREKHLDEELSVLVSEDNCYYSTEEKKWSYSEIAYSCIILTFLVFVTFATIFHLTLIYCKDKGQKNLSSQCIIAFSVIENVAKIISIKGKRNENNLDCIFGIRTLSMGFILGGHALTFLISSPVLNAHFAEEAVQKVQNAIFLNNPLLVDTFLLVSGFLFCRLLLLELDKRKGKLNPFVLYIARYIRLTPAYMVVIGFYCTLLLRTGSGPLWEKRMTLERDRCLQSWWTNAIYLNNYLKTDHLCMFQSWYLSVDTQLFILAPLLIFPLWYKKTLGEIILSATFVITALIPFVVTCAQQLDPTLMVYPAEINDLSRNEYFKKNYIKTHIRANSYIMGVIFGYAVHKIQLKKFKIPFIARVIFGILAAVSGLSAMFSISIFYQPHYEYNFVDAASYAALHRIAWCFAIGWTLLVCVTSGSYVDDFLSWKAWAPFSRITYCAYLVNGYIELYIYGEMRTPRYLSIFSLGAEVGAHIVLTVLAAFVLCVLFESPIHNLEKLLLKKVVHKSTDDETSIKKEQEMSIEIPTTPTTESSVETSETDDSNNKTVI